MAWIAANLIDFTVKEILGREKYSKNLSFHACKILNIYIYRCLLLHLSNTTEAIEVVSTSDLGRTRQ